MSVRIDHDTFLEANPDVKVWLKDYRTQSIALFEPIIRNSIAATMNGEMAKMLGVYKEG